MSKKLNRIAALALVGALATGCYLYKDKRDKVLIPGIDIDQTIQVAEMELAKNRFGTVLTVWAMRDQILTGPQAEKISELYFRHIDRIDSDKQKARTFSVWHLTWAISNMYRLGDEFVKVALQTAYEDAEKRVDKLDKNVSTKHFKGDSIVMGDAHGGGRAYAKSHLVVPGNKKYLQSFEEYKKKQEEKEKKKKKK
jgi:hypothetical protein